MRQQKRMGRIICIFRLLANGYVYAGTSDVKKNEQQCIPIAMVQREEHDGTRQYVIEKIISI